MQCLVLKFESKKFLQKSLQFRTDSPNLILHCLQLFLWGRKTMQFLAGSRRVAVSTPLVAAAKALQVHQVQREKRGEGERGWQCGGGQEVSLRRPH